MGRVVSMFIYDQEAYYDMQPWKIIARRSPETKNRWVHVNITPDHPKVWEKSQEILRVFAADAKAEKIWLVTRRVGNVGENKWEMVWKPRRRKGS